jgi:hypothetical protein
MSAAPDFEKLREARDAQIEEVARAVRAKLGGDPLDPFTFHSRDYHSPCFCACPDGPCEHQFQGERQFDDGLGSEQFCSRCGEGAMSHSMRFDI